MPILATVRKAKGINASVEIRLRAVSGDIVFVGGDPKELARFKDGQQVSVKLTRIKK